MVDFAVSKRLGLRRHWGTIRGVLREWLRTGVTAVATLLLHRLWLRFKQRQQCLADRHKWRAREDFGNVQACMLTTVNLEACGRIEKRTVMTKRFEDVFTNLHVRNMIREAADKTTNDNPFVLSHLKMSDRWHVLNEALNHLSSVFGPYHLFANSVMCYESHWYCFTLLGTRTSGGGRFFITPHRKVSEKADVGAMRIRFMLVDEQELRKVCSGEILPPAEFFAERHRERWEVIRHFADVFGKQLAQPKAFGGFAHGAGFQRGISWSLSSKQRYRSGCMPRPPESSEDDLDDSEVADRDCNNFQRIHVPIPLVSYTKEIAPQDVVLYE